MHIVELASRDSASRRHFMRHAALFSLGVGLSTNSLWAQAKAPTPVNPKQAKALIYIFNRGGMSHLDTFDPKEGEALMGKTTAISTNVAGIRFGDKLEKLAKHADKMAVINGMMSVQAEHERGAYIMRTGYPRIGTISHPTIGPFAERLLGKPEGQILPASVIVGEGTSNAGYLDPKFSPLPIADPSGGVPNSSLITETDRFDKRMKVAQKLGQEFVKKYDYDGPKSYVEYYDQATKLLRGTELAAFDLSGESNRETYGMSRVGQGCLLARRLVEHGVRVIEVINDGWDMHVGIDQGIGTKGTEFDQAFSALLDDLKAKGLLDSTLVAVATEFGRTPEINFNAGRDHHSIAYSAVLAGGGVKGGQVWGKSDKQGKKIIENKVAPEDWVATIGYGLGLNMDETIYAPNGRPFTFADKGTPVTQLFG
jgi:uncharacterized protein (DUF1501 family)